MESVHQFLKNSIKPSDRLLLACSGGPDSMALFNLMLESKCHFEVAHVNYQLRGKASEADEDLVRSECDKNGILCHTHRCQIEAADGKSIQSVAREIRYGFFNQLITKNSYNYLVTAHHQNDLIENYIFRSARGSGLKGLVSFSSVSQNILRPLLQVTKEEIYEYLNNHQLKYREDESNLSDKYSRNKIRNKVIPDLKALFPNLEKRFQGTIDNLSQDYELIQLLIRPYRNKLLDESFNLDASDPFFTSPSFWYYLLPKLSESETKKIVNACSNGVKDFELWHKNYLIRIKNHHITIEAKPETFQETTIKNTTEFFKLRDAGKLHFEIELIQINEVNYQDNALYLDHNSIHYPLTLRHPKKGDKFQPLGMIGTKLLSDFYNDIGITAKFKKYELLLEDANTNIIACIPHRIHEKFKISEGTKEVLKISLPNSVAQA